MYCYDANNKLINLDETLDKVVNELKNNLIKYMLLKHNIGFLNDEVEAQIYDIIFEVLKPLIYSAFL